ncbi:zinc-dependent alcohol dehydrogenase [Chloroflexus aggregans]|uniref:Alcohol dehydrogenase zinc-binding domain protein n=1 Tax=Chloroflexus aggregans (strain MD-66 / DSM 9485) TaxID=326427 RepID=B8G7W2_CHLAD|nr:zinc-binding alcohol dehydrogenase [Chloroflexus aggregans]ACL24141.1 Alcohol dehydrogenase zinc-binding domain protein [Chloroflexus aggregans DSM 9485]
MVSNITTSTRSVLPADAIWFPAPRTVTVCRETAPPPDAGEVQVAAIASLISHGTERLVYRGEVDPTLPLDLPTLRGSFAFPIKYGYAIAGRIIDVGPGVDDLRIGDAVAALHPHQSIFTIPAALVKRLPANLDPALGGFYANVETALTICHDAAPRLGETVIVFGQGVIGLLVTQLLQLAGVHVIAVDPDPQRRELAARFGATALAQPDPAVIADLTDKRGADIAIEVSGAPTALQQAIEAVTVEGLVIVASWYGQKPVTLTLGGHFHRGRVRVRSSQVGRLAPETLPRWDYTRRTATVMRLLPRLHLAELVSHRFPLEQAPAAYALLDAGTTGLVQVMISYR